MSQHVHGRARRIAALVPILLLVFATPAAARTTVIPPYKQTGRTLVYKVGQLEAGELRSARLRAPRRVVHLGLARVRAAIERTRLRVRMPRRWIRARHRARRLTRMSRWRRHRIGHQRWRQARRRARLAGRRPKLVVVTEKAAAQAEPSHTGPAPERTAPGPGTPGRAPAPYPNALGPIPEDAYYLSESGSDANPGSAELPWRTLDKAIESVRAGDTVVLRAGTYGARGTTTVMGSPGTSTAPVTWRGPPDEAMPTLLGHVKISAGHQRFSHLLFDGPTGTVKPLTSDNPDGEQVQISITGSSVDGIDISGCEIRNSGWHAGIFLSGARDARIVGNYIHDNGDFADPSQANQSHGIYWHSGSGLIANNLIEHNVARGIQLYQEPHDVTIAHNTIVRNGKTGIQFANDTRDSLAVGNVVALNGEYGIRASELAGSGNVARGNLLWGNPEGDLALLGKLATEDNVVQDGRFAPGYRLEPTSPGIDRGLPSYAGPVDYLGAPRPLGAAPDLGALESH
jgi:Right handed beta helix region/Protein of unknown function (DUF1565)